MATEELSAEEVAKWHRRFACEFNNRAWTIAEDAGRSAVEVEEMIDAAHAAALHWGKVGTELHRANADMLLGMAHAIAGNGQRALYYAERCHDFFAKRESADWEMAFAHAVLANAARVAGEIGLFKRHRAKAAEFGEAMEAGEERTNFERTFRLIDG